MEAAENDGEDASCGVKLKLDSFWKGSKGSCGASASSSVLLLSSKEAEEEVSSTARCFPLTFELARGELDGLGMVISVAYEVPAAPWSIPSAPKSNVERGEKVNDG